MTVSRSRRGLVPEHMTDQPYDIQDIGTQVITIDVSDPFRGRRSIVTERDADYSDNIEHIEDRVSIEVDEQNRIVRANCG